MEDQTPEEAALAEKLAKLQDDVSTLCHQFEAIQEKLEPLYEVYSNAAGAILFMAWLGKVFGWFASIGSAIIIAWATWRYGGSSK